jgi:Uma2 family endonuclease
MSNIQTLLPTSTWVKATWDEYLQQIESPSYEKAKGYYYDGYLRIEMLPVGRDHASDHTIIILAVGLFTLLKGIAANGFTDCSYRKTGIRECQPDVSYYFGTQAQAVPSGTNIINLDVYPPPNLVIEISKTTVIDDRTSKRELYEELGVVEYWVVDVEKMHILAYEIIDRGSRRIDASTVLPGLAMSTLEQALRQSRETNQSQVGAWLMSQFS